MEVALFILIVCVIAVYLLFIRKKKPKPSTPEVVKHPYTAVRIKPHQHACNAAFDMSHRVFLVSEAPKLPLNDCDKADSCRCSYVHYDDRRRGQDRRGESLVMRDAYNKKERRDDEHHGRRKTDPGNS